MRRQIVLVASGVMLAECAGEAIAGGREVSAIALDQGIGADVVRLKLFTVERPSTRTGSSWYARPWLRRLRGSIGST